MVYGLALYVVGRSARAKLRIAHAAGWIQALLALGALAEVVRRTFADGQPEPPLMMAVASVALAANSFCLWLVSRNRAGGVHMKASAIFSANDVLANLGVVVAGVLVAVTGSQYPDLVRWYCSTEKRAIGSGGTAVEGTLHSSGRYGDPDQG